MEETALKIHVLMSRDFARSTQTQPGEGAMPAPKGPLLVAADALCYTPSVELLPGLLSYYPLKLSDILRREQLRAHFDFYCSNYLNPLPTCFTRDELNVRERELMAFADEPVAAWNLVQLRVAGLLIDNAPKNGRAVSSETIRAVQHSPQQFYAALTAPVSNLQ